MDRTIECSLSQLEPELREPISYLLEKDEKVITCYKTEWHMVWVQLITRKRVIVQHAYFIRSSMSFRKPVIERPITKSMELSLIENVEMRIDEDYDIYKVQILDRQGQTLEACFITRPKADVFIHSLRYTIDNYRSIQEGQENRHFHRMQELTKMHQAGLISYQEYEEKRKEILSDL